jgi:hypothetical protein
MGALSYVAALVFSRWSLQTSGSIAHLHARYDLSHLNFTHFFFTIPPLAGIAILLCFLGGMLGIAWLLLRRAEPHVRE